MDKQNLPDSGDAPTVEFAEPKQFLGNADGDNDTEDCNCDEVSIAIDFDLKAVIADTIKQALLSVNQADKASDTDNTDNDGEAPQSRHYAQLQAEIAEVKTQVLDAVKEIASKYASLEVKYEVLANENTVLKRGLSATNNQVKKVSADDTVTYCTV